MPRTSARSTRLPTKVRLRRVIGLACAAIGLACSDDGGSGGSSAPSGSTVSADPTQTAVTIAWSSASGSVAGYAVYVQRDSTEFKREIDVAEPRAQLRGAPGTTARVIVVAFTPSKSHYGPSSPPSARFTFPQPSTTTASAAGSSGASAMSVAGSAAAASAESDSAVNASPSSESTSEWTVSGGLIVWQSAGDAYRLTDATLATTRLFAGPSGTQLAGVADFDPDGEGDPLWSGAYGALTYTSGHALRSSDDAVATADLGMLADGDRVLGAGDFDGDGRGDVLVANGDAVSARISVPGAALATSELGTAPQSMLAGIADFDGNASDDLVWRTATGALVVWLLDGGAASATIELAVDADVMGAGDFDGDGSAELALRDATGSVFVLHPDAATPMLEASDLTGASAFGAVGAVDLDRDGSEELVLASSESIRFASLPGDQMLSLEPDSPWHPVQLLP